jgi:hypothetical protein
MNSFIDIKNDIRVDEVEDKLIGIIMQDEVEVEVVV